ncbi:hypothetical protein M0811_00896 [Anaeramoeba ignava]|uniref:Uncharacterized protein n=1 Tax=Anaeramoeba ignava TaxID=1746090 RepID=A0A9Q0LJX3_ANAIG|nr:hypothetical protein M0811_00896 [Anaeramoeba ignava]
MESKSHQEIEFDSPKTIFDFVSLPSFLDLSPKTPQTTTPLSWDSSQFSFLIEFLRLLICSVEYKNTNQEMPKKAKGILSSIQSYPNCFYSFISFQINKRELKKIIFHVCLENDEMFRFFKDIGFDIFVQGNLDQKKLAASFLGQLTLMNDSFQIAHFKEIYNQFYSYERDLSNNWFVLDKMFESALNPHLNKKKQMVDTGFEPVTSALLAQRSTD